MAIDIKNLLEFAQRDISTIDSTSNTQTVLDLFRLANRAGPTLHMYDSTSDLPNLVDDTADTAQIAYVKSKKELYFNNGSWKPQTTTGPQPPPSYSFQGSNYGYTSGGSQPTFNLHGTSLYYTNVIQKNSFTSDANATDVGDLSTFSTSGAGQSSADNGYHTGGLTYVPSPPSYLLTIDKFSFASDGNATSSANILSPEPYYVSADLTGQSSENYGYVSGSSASIPNPLSTSATDVIQKFPFASDDNATDVGNLTDRRSGAAGQSSTTHGYTSGGQNGSPAIKNVVDKFPFSSDANATDVGDLTAARRYCAGQSSTTHGYTSGVYFPVDRDIIDKFSFASDENAADVGNLTIARDGVAGQSSTTHGYTSGGQPPAGRVNTIDKFPFASDTNASDVGDLTQLTDFASGQQY